MISELQNVDTDMFIGALALIYDHFIKIYIPENGGRGGEVEKLHFSTYSPPFPTPPPLTGIYMFMKLPYMIDNAQINTLM